MSEQTAELVRPLPGAENAISWPTPPIPGTSMLTFHGSGNSRTEEFVLPGDASVRMVVEKGPCVIRVLRPDGTDATTRATMPGGGMALGAITKGGTYTLEVRTTGLWGITVVYGLPK